MYAYTPDNPLGEKLHTYGLSYLEIFRQWFIATFFIVVAVMVAAPSTSSAPLIGIFLSLIGYFVHCLILELNPKSITVYERGISYRFGKEERSWRWEQITTMTGTRHTFRVNGIPILRYGANTFYAGPEPAFSVSHKTAEAHRLVTLIFMKMAECQVPRYVAAYQQGKRLTFGTIYVDQTGIANPRQKIGWPDVAAFRVKGNSFRLKGYGESKEIDLGRIQPPNSYLLLGTLDRILDTHSFANMQQTHIRGPVRWLGVPRTLVLMVGIPLALIVIWFGLASISDQYTATHDQAERDQLVNLYGANINTLCASAKEHPDGPPSSDVIRYVVVNADRSTVFTDFQNALDKSQVATSKQDLTAVICLTATSQEVERCDYGDGNSADWHVSRVQEGYRISIVDVATGHTFATGTIGGDMPGSCPDETYDGDSSIHGSPPTADKLLKWLHDLNSPQGSTA